MDFADLASELARVARERDAYLDHLTATQARCTELVTSMRGLPVSDLVAGLERARALHPEGANLAALISEAGEYSNELLRGPARLHKQREEILDAAIVCIRIYVGEVAP